MKLDCWNPTTLAKPKPYLYIAIHVNRLLSLQSFSLIQPTCTHHARLHNASAIRNADHIWSELIGLTCNNCGHDERLAYFEFYHLPTANDKPTVCLEQHSQPDPQHHKSPARLNFEPFFPFCFFSSRSSHGGGNRSHTHFTSSSTVFVLQLSFGWPSVPLSSGLSLVPEGVPVLVISLAEPFYF